MRQMSAIPCWHVAAAADCGVGPDHWGETKRDRPTGNGGDRDGAQAANRSREQMTRGVTPARSGRGRLETCVDVAVAPQIAVSAGAGDVHTRAVLGISEGPAAAAAAAAAPSARVEGGRLATGQHTSSVGVSRDNATYWAATAAPAPATANSGCACRALPVTDGAHHDVLPLNSLARGTCWLVMA